MILSTSENKSGGVNFRRTVIVYLALSVFCGAFALTYNQFAHGVHSRYMTWLFALPLVLGAFPSLFFIMNKSVHSPGRLCFNLWNSGTAALTVSSLLRGILVIAGTGSHYQVWLMYAGGLMLLLSAILYLLHR